MSVGFDLCKLLIFRGRTAGLQEKLDAYLANDRLTAEEYTQLAELLKREE